MFLVLTCAIFCATAVRAEDDRIVAVVNDEIITLSELKNYITTGYLSMAQKNLPPDQLEKLKVDLEVNGLSRMIEDSLLLSKANELKVKVPDRTLEERMKVIKEKYPSEKAFQDALTQSGTTLADLKEKFRDQIKIQMFIESEIRSRVNINPNEVIVYYKQKIKDYWQKDQVELRSIFIDYSKDKAAAEKRLGDLKQAIRSGEDFEKLAKVYSDSPSIGVVKKGELVPQIEKVVFNLQEGQISPIVETDTGYYVFQLKKRIPMKVSPFQDVKDQLKNELYQKKFKDEYQKYVDDLKKKAYVEIKH